MTNNSNTPNGDPTINYTWQQFDQMIDKLAVKLIDLVQRDYDNNWQMALWVVPITSAMPVATALFHCLRNRYGIDQITKQQFVVIDPQSDSFDQLLDRVQQTIDRQYLRTATRAVIRPGPAPFLIVVEDIIDSGHSFNHLINMIALHEQRRDSRVITDGSLGKSARVTIATLVSRVDPANLSNRFHKQRLLSAVQLPPATDGVTPPYVVFPWEYVDPR